MADGLDLLAAQRAVFRSTLRAPEKLVALALLDHWSRSTDTFPSVVRLSAWTSLDRRTVLRCLQSLEHAAAIMVTRASGRPNVYTLGSLMALPVSESHRCLSGTSVTESPVSESHQCQPDTPPVSESHRTGVTESPEGTQQGTQQGTQGGSTPEEGTPSGETTKPGTRRARRAKPLETPMPSDWEPSQAHRALAAKHGVDLELETVKFRGWADGRLAVSWNGRFSTWLGNAAGFKRERAQRAPVQQGRYVPPAGAAKPDTSWLDEPGGEQ